MTMQNPPTKNRFGMFTRGPREYKDRKTEIGLIGLAVRTTDRERAAVGVCNAQGKIRDMIFAVPDPIDY